VATRLRSSRQLAVDGLREAKKAVNELREPDDQSAVDLVEMLAELLSGPVAGELGLGLDVAGRPWPVPRPVASALASVCREAVTNLNKHAPAGPMTLSLIYEPESVVLELVNAVPPTSTPGVLSGTGAGLGVPGMRARMAEVGGSLSAGAQGSRWVVRAGWRRS
jgi:signal transduction histidine kinase